MPSSWLESPLHHHLPDHCEPSSAFLTWISSFVHICLPTPLALLSSTLGTLSIVSWLFAQLPQIYKNYTIKSTAGLSVFFLVEWLLGDAANLTGAILTNQAGWQVTIAGYYVTVDIALVLQYYWYTYLNSWQLPQFRYLRQLKGDEGEGDLWENIPPSDCSSCQQVPPSRLLPSSPGQKDVTKPSTQPTKTTTRNSLANEKLKSIGNTRRYTKVSRPGPLVSSPKAILFASMMCAVLANATSPTSPAPYQKNPLNPPHSDPTPIAGSIASWLSTVLYLGSRIPQLVKNHRRKSTSGLSPLLFLAAFSGNFFYSSSLFTNPNGWNNFPPYGGGGWAGPDGNQRWEWVSRAIPFWLGAAGVLVLDGAMGVQFLKYREQNDEIIIGVKPPGRGRRRWKKVTGWMRGWIPSTSPDRGSATLSGEAQSLLGRETGRYGGV
ncbi:hypothetical protein FQN57_003930 [Myotisia sp. PD_48]|nr:hypothetical protein FQN57_003930 [Myotisia sp. PD_48]